MRDEVKRRISNGEVDLRMYTQRQNDINTKRQLADYKHFCNVNNSHIKHTAYNKKWKSDT